MTKEVCVCESFEDIAEVFKRHFKSKQDTWIASSKLAFLKDKVPPKHFRYYENLPCVYFKFKESATTKIASRAFDLCLAIGIMAVSSPVWLLCATVIPVESQGPIFYTDKRCGKDGEPIDFLKFRSMVADQEEDNQRLELRKRVMNEKVVAGTKHTKDSRITRFGKFIRKHSIDELPQLLAVIKGDLSLVGPRAYKIDETESMQQWHKVRLIDKPGVTGFWQTHGRSNVPFNESILMDMYDLAHKDMMHKFKVVLKTPVVMLSGEGSY